MEEGKIDNCDTRSALKLEGSSIQPSKQVKVTFELDGTNWKDITEGGAHLNKEPLSEDKSPTIKTTR